MSAEGTPFTHHGRGLDLYAKLNRDGYDMTWQARASCATSGEPDAWFLTKEGDNAAQYVMARIVCDACPVALDCLRFALDNHEEHGLWGGFAPRDRQEIRRRMEEASVNHGTEYAYTKLKCRCLDCRAYKSAKNRAYREAHPKTRRRADDGIVDEVVVERLIDGRMTWQEATMRERLTAARVTFGREGWFGFCEKSLRLNSAKVSEIAAELRQAVAS